MGLVFNREASGKTSRERGVRLVGGIQGQVAFGMLHTPVFRVLALPAFTSAVALIHATRTHLSSNKPVEKQARNQPAPASACNSHANRLLTCRRKSLGSAPPAVPSASDEWCWSLGVVGAQRHLQF